MRVAAIIPARYASTRFPGKPLAPIAGKPMLQRVYERAQAAGFDVAIATDDARIFKAAQGFGATVWMTDPAHPSGTDRLLEVAAHLPGYHAYLNVQGDEPFVDPGSLQTLAELVLAGHAPIRIGTLVRPLQNEAELTNPNAVKAVLARDGRALYFSRAAVPYHRGPGAQHWKHLGLYGFTADALTAIRALKPSPLELAERLEQLRWLEAGLPIYAQPVADESPAIDTPEDLQRVEALIAAGKLDV